MRFLILAVLCVSGQLLHYVNGQECQITVPLDPPMSINDDVLPNELFKLYDVTGDVTRVTGKANEYFTFSIADSAFCVTPNEKLNNFYDDRPTAYDIVISEVVLICNGGTPSTEYNFIRVVVVDKNNKPPEFIPANEVNYAISLPHYDVPVNWENFIRVTDKDFLEANTLMNFDLEPKDVITFTSNFPERVPADDTKPLEYYKLYFSLLKTVTRPGPYSITLSAANSDTHTTTLKINLDISKVDVEPPKIVQELEYYANDFVNAAGESLSVAQVVDDLDPFDDLEVTLQGAVPEITSKFDAVIEMDGTVSLTLNEAIDPELLRHAQFLLRLTVEVKDHAGNALNFPLAIRFEDEDDGLVFLQVYYRWDLVTAADEDASVGTVALNTLDGVEFTIAPEDASVPAYLIIGREDGVITHKRTGDELVASDRTVDVFKVTATKSGIVPVEVPIVIYNKPKAELFPPTTTAEPCTTETPPTPCTCETTTVEPVTCTTEVPTPCTPTTCETTTTIDPVTCSTECPPCTTTPENCPTSTTACSDTPCPSCTTTSSYESSPTTCSDTPCPPCSTTPTTCPDTPSTQCPPCSTTPSSESTPSSECPPPTPCPNPATEPPSDDDCSNTGLIIGIIIASVIAVIAIGVAIYLFYKRSQQSHSLFKGLVPTENPSGYEKFTSDPERGPRDSLKVESSINTSPGGELGLGESRHGTMPRDSISMGRTLDVDGGALNQNIANVPLQGSSDTSKNIYPDLYAYPKTPSHENPYSEPKETDSEIYARPVSEAPSTSALLSEPPDAEPLVQEPKVDYKVVEFGGVEVFPLDAEEEEVERL